jgi:membrane protein
VSGRERTDGRDDGAGRAAEAPSDIPAPGWKSIAKRVMAEVKEDQVQAVAAGLAFYAMLAIFPALIALVSIYGLVADPADVQEQVTSIAEALPSDAAGVVEEQLGSIVDSSSGALGWAAILSIIGALWTASSGVQQLIKSVNNAYDEEETRGFVRLRGLALLLTLGFMVVALLSLGLIVVIPPLLDSLSLGQGATWLIDIGRFLLLGAVVMVVLALIYRVAPDRDDPRWRWVSWGAVIATIIWIAASILFSVFVSQFGSYQETYGALAGVIVLLMWLFISAFIVLLGAEINSEIEHQTAVDTTTGEPAPMGRRGAVKADTVA